MYILFLCWTLELYRWSWHETVVRKESELIEVDRKLAKILFFIKNTDGMSVVSIILGLTAHAGMILFLFLVIFSKTVNRYMRILFFFMVCSQHAFSGGRGIDRDIYQKEKSQNKTRQDKELSSVGTIILGFIVVGTMIYMVVRQALALKNAVALLTHGSV